MLILIGILVVAFAGAAYYLFGTNSSSLVGQGTDPVADRLQADLSALQKERQDLLPSLDSIFSDARFQALQPYGNMPVQPGATGRTNPFLPF